MLESVAAGLLNRFLGSYVKNFDPKQLNIGIWNGDVKLRNLDLKREALDKFKLPIDVVEGHLGELVMQIPWSNLKNKPVKIVIEDVYLLANPKLNQDYDAEEEERRSHALKMEKLENAELLHRDASSTMTDEELQKNQSFTDSLVTKIVDNVQITIKNIHVRYEDFDSVPGHPFSVGLTLEELSAVSTDGDWNPVFIQNVTQISRKLLKLNSLSIYWNTDSKSIRPDEDADESLVELFRASIPRSDNELESNQYILKPVSGMGRLTMNKNGPTETAPKTKAEMLFDDLGFVFDSDQYRDALWTADLFRLYMKTKDFKKYRPTVSVKEDPKAWFKYAGNVVLGEIHQKRKEWSWDYINERRESRLRYIVLFKQKQTATLSQDELDEFNQFEWDLSYEDIRFYRSLAKAELRKEHAKIKTNEPAKNQQSGGWMSWVWGGQGEQQNSASTEDISMTDEQTKELYDAIEWDEKKAIQDSVDIPRDRVKFELQTSLKTGSFKLRRDPHGKDEDLAIVHFNGFKADFWQRPDSFLANVSLHELRVDDKTKSSLYEQVVTVKDIASHGHSHHLEHTDEGTLQTNADDNSFFWLSFESNPLDGSADSSLKVKLKSVTVFYNCVFVENIMRFFKPPRAHLETIGAIMNAAGATVEGLRDQTRIGLEYALTEHKTIDINMDLQAPLIVLPLDVKSWESPCAIIDAGHISIISDLVKSDVLEDVKNKQKQSYTDSDWRRLESLMYDKFNLQMHDTQFLLGSSVRETIKHLHKKEDSPLYVIDKVNMDFVIEISIVPEAKSLTKFKVSGHLPLFRAQMSDTKYKVMMQIIDKSIPNFDFDSFDSLAANTVIRDRGLSLLGGERPIFESSDPDTVPRADEKNASDADQKVFSFNFKVDKVDMSLHRCMDSDTFAQEPVVDMILEHFELDYYYKPNEMAADVTLSTLCIEEYIEKSSELDLRRIATSKPGAIAKDLFNVQYKRTKREGQPDVNDQQVEVSMSTIKFVLSPKTSTALLDFVITTFTNPDQPQIEASDQASIASEAENVNDNKIDVKVNLSSIIVVLNDDGIELATVQLDSATVGVALVSQTLRVDSRIGSLTIRDDINRGAHKESALRQLVSLEGDDLMLFRYETFDRQQKDLEYTSEIFFRAGSIKVNVVEEPISRILKLLMRFNRMRGLYDAARQVAVNQANQLQDPDKMRIDVVISTPILVFPQTMSEEGTFDSLTSRLGEFYMKNSFKLDNDVLSNKMTAGLRSTNLATEFVVPDGKQTLEILDSLDLTFDLEYLSSISGSAIDRPTVNIDGGMSEVDINLTELQFKYIMDLLTSVAGIFSGLGGEDEEVGELERELQHSNRIDTANSTSEESTPGSNDRLNFTFNCERIALTVYQHTGESVSVTDKSLSRFSLNRTGIKAVMAHDSTWDADTHIHSFTVHDTRTLRENKFSEIIPSVNHSEYQFMCKATKRRRDGPIDLLLTVDSPRMILALDYLFALKSFIDFGLAKSPSISEAEIESPPVSDNETEAIEYADVHGDSNEDSQGPGIAFHINVVDAYLILLANAGQKDSEAVVFKTDQMVLSQRETTTLSISKVGVFLCQMSKFDENRLRILDDFSMTASIDNRGSDALHQLSNIQVSVEPLILRLSLRDVLLALNIVKNASKLSESETQANNALEDAKSTLPKYSKFSKRQLRKNLKSTRSEITTSTKSVAKRQRGGSISALAEAIVRGEQLVAEFEGFRLVVIGMHHELPMLDMSVKPFTATARNWSSDLMVSIGAETFANIYNPSKSAWEPLVESWDIGLHVARESAHAAIFLNMVSRRLMQVTLTAQTLALLNHSYVFLQEKREDDDFLTRPRESDAPYTVRNETGYTVEVWVDKGDKADGEDRENLHVIEDGDEIPWRFYDWSIVRENLTTDIQEVNLGVKLVDSPFEPVTGVSVTSVGEHLHILYPKVNKILHRLLCDVQLKEDLKKITLRSALDVHNRTHVSLDLEVPNTGLSWTLKPGDTRAVPIKYAYDYAIRIRPDRKLGFVWSEALRWKSLQNESPSIPCQPSNPRDSSAFFFQVDARFDKNVPLARVYPLMSLVISAPIEIVNLLPVDFSYRVYDKNTKKDWSNFIKKGGTSPVHVVQLSHLLLLSVHPKDAGFDQTDFAIVNSRSSEFKREKYMVARSADGQKLTLNISYLSPKETGHGYRIVVSTPYLILNKTGLDLQIRNRSNIATSRVSHIASEAGDSIKRASPMMWSYDYIDQSNRAVIRIGESKWSGNQSFEAIGSNYEVVIPSNNNQTEIHLGVSVQEGEGRYMLTKIVTITPRFVLVNKMSEDIMFKDPGSSNTLTLKSKKTLAVNFMKHAKEKQIVASFMGAGSQWSSAFNINNVGRTHVKLNKHQKGYVLLKIDTILEGATLYLHISDAGKNWPYSMRNFTHQNFIFWQANPYVDDEGIELANHPDFVPIKYRVPGKSVMPYSWDYPAAPVKEIIIECNGRQRRVQLAEIGNLPPMKVPATVNSPGCIVDLNVVADGPTQTLVFSDYDPSMSMYKLKKTQSRTSINASSSAVNSQVEFSVDQDEDDKPLINASIKFEGVGISLINKRLLELCYITLRGFEFNYRSSELYDTFTAKVKWIQIDNELYGGFYPIILYPSVVPKSGREMENHPTFSASITRVKDDSHGVLYIKHATVLLQEITFEMDEDFLFALMEFAQSHNGWNSTENDKLCDESLDIPEPLQTSSGLDVYFELLHIQPAQMDLSFVRTERINVEERPSNGNAVMFFFNMLTMAIGNINDAPVKLNALVMENVRTPLPLLVQSMRTHYSQEFLYQVHKILGSADFLGNPVGLFNNLSSGFMDMFYEPYQGYVLNDRPQELGIGIAKGGLSFMKKSIYGVSDSITKVTGSISKGLSVATLDKEFQDKRRIKRQRNRPKHALYGIANGANSFAESVASGFSGLALNPIQGAEKEGAAGFFKGLGKGLVGLPTKTTIGLFDFASSISEGVRNTTTVFDSDAIDKVRPARYIGPDGVVRPFSEREAIGQSWVKQVDDGRFFDDVYIAHLNMGGDDMAVILTLERIMLVSTVKLTTEWVVKFRDLQTVAMERTGLALILRGGVQGPFIPISDVSSRRFLYKEVGVAVQEFNRKNQTLT